MDIYMEWGGMHDLRQDGVSEYINTSTILVLILFLEKWKYTNLHFVSSLNI